MMGQANSDSFGFAGQREFRRGPRGWYAVRLAQGGRRFSVSPANRTDGELPATHVRHGRDVVVYQSVQVTPALTPRHGLGDEHCLSDELILRISKVPSNGAGASISDVDSSGTVSGSPISFRQLDTGAVRASGALRPHPSAAATQRCQTPTPFSTKPGLSAACPNAVAGSSGRLTRTSGSSALIPWRGAVLGAAAAPISLNAAPARCVRQQSNVRSRQASRRLGAY